MELPSFVPSPEDGLELLSSVARHLEPAYEFAVFESKNFIESRGFECDVNTLLTLVRLHAKNFLLKAGLSGIQYENGSLSPLSFSVNGAFFKSWKAAAYELPRPSTGGRRRFINQQCELNFDYGTAKKIKNFVILWNLGPQNQITLWLVCPKRYDDDERIAEAWWHIQIDDPASTIEVRTEVGTPSSDLPIASVADERTGTRKR